MKETVIKMRKSKRENKESKKEIKKGERNKETTLREIKTVRKDRRKE